jgi:2-dehydro-3-deoxyphosphogluconate aldolase/(4S)-4-hydroxy-2-oxoglutarate aldolase
VATPSQIVQQIEATGVVAIIRASSSGELIDVVSALRDGGLTCIEVTMTTPDALEVIHAAREKMGDSAAIGVGTVLDAETARAAILAGAQFVVAPIFDPPTVALCKRYSVPVVPAGMTPTEMVHAWQAGADFVKLFPASGGGAGLIRDLKGPLPQIKIIPTGGINLDNCADFIKAGAAALGIGSALVTREAVKNKDFAGLRSAAAAWLQRVDQARASLK